MVTLIIKMNIGIVAFVGAVAAKAQRYPKLFGEVS